MFHLVYAAWDLRLSVVRENQVIGEMCWWVQWRGSWRLFPREDGRLLSEIAK